MSLEPALKNIENVIKKNKTKQLIIENAITSITDEIDALIEGLESENKPFIFKDKTSHFADKLKYKKLLAPIIKVHKDFYVFLSKMGKSLAKVFSPEINSTILSNEMDRESMIIALSTYFQSERVNGLNFDMLDEQREISPHLNIVAEDNRVLRELENISSNIKLLEFDEIYDWIETNHLQLRDCDSAITKTIIMLKASKLKNSGAGSDAILYMIEKGDLFKNDQLSLGQFLYSLTILDHELPSLYISYRESELSRHLESLMKTALKKLQGFRAEEPIFTVFKHGLLSLPWAIPALQLSQFQDLDDTSSDLHLSFPTPLHPPVAHSVIICPIAKEPCTILNPPCLLSCGHVVSRRALGISSSVKCPTCPATQPRHEVRPLFFTS